jgi:hypothetical protein
VPALDAFEFPVGRNVHQPLGEARSLAKHVVGSARVNQCESINARMWPSFTHAHTHAHSMPSFTHAQSHGRQPFASPTFWAGRRLQYAAYSHYARPQPRLAIICTSISLSSRRPPMAKAAGGRACLTRPPRMTDEAERHASATTTTDPPMRGGAACWGEAAGRPGAPGRGPGHTGAGAHRSSSSLSRPAVAGTAGIAPTGVRERGSLAGGAVEHPPAVACCLRRRGPLPIRGTGTRRSSRLSRAAA